MTELATPSAEGRPLTSPTTATLWRVIVRWKTQASPLPIEHQPQLLMLTTADPSGEELFAVVRTRCKELDPLAIEIRLVEVQCVAEVFGTVARLPRTA